MPWQAPDIQLQWGDFFKPDPEEQAKIIDMAKKALAADNSSPLITLRKAVEKIAPIFGIENVDALVKEIEAEREAAAQKDVEKTKAEAEALHSLASMSNGDDSAAQARGGAQGGGNPPQDDRGGGRGPAAPAPKGAPGKRPGRNA